MMTCTPQTLFVVCFFNILSKYFKNAKYKRKNLK